MEVQPRPTTNQTSNKDLANHCVLSSYLQPTFLGHSLALYYLRTDTAQRLCPSCLMSLRSPPLLYVFTRNAFPIAFPFSFAFHEHPAKSHAVV